MSVTTSTLPSPLTPPECDLRDYKFLPLEISRLFGSHFHSHADNDEWRAGVTLWLKSYHQVPAASMPDDDIDLARHAEFGTQVKGWRKVRAMALHGWVKCSDSRLYHPVVAEKALEGWIEKLRGRKSSAAGNAKRYNHDFDAAPFDTAIGTAAGMLASLNPGSALLRIKALSLPPGAVDPPTSLPPGSQVKEREVKEREQQQQERADARLLGCFKEFYEAFPRKTAEKAASTEYAAALAVTTPEIILAAAQRYAVETKCWDPKHILGPARWLQDARWTDRGVEPTKTAFNSPEEQEGQRLARERAYGVSE